MIRFSIVDTKAELVRLIDADSVSLAGCRTTGGKRELIAHRDGLRQALITVDLAERYAVSGQPVELRQSDGIIDEVRAAIE